MSMVPISHKAAATTTKQDSWIYLLGKPWTNRQGIQRVGALYRVTGVVVPVGIVLLTSMI